MLTLKAFFKQRDALQEQVVGENLETEAGKVPVWATEISTREAVFKSVGTRVPGELCIAKHGPGPPVTHAPGSVRACYS